MLAAILTTLVTHSHSHLRWLLVTRICGTCCIACLYCYYTANATTLAVFGSAQPCYACAACVLAGARHVAAPPSPTWCLQHGTTALMWASELGDTVVVKMLSDKGANVDLSNKVRQRLILGVGAGRRRVAGMTRGGGADASSYPHNTSHTPTPSSTGSL